MRGFPTFAARELPDWDRAEAIALAAAQGPHGLYVHNALLAGEGETLVLYGREALLGLCWFGPRGNLIAMWQTELAPTAVAAAVLRAPQPWRIALGPAPLVDELQRRVRRRHLVWRDQVYYQAAGGPPVVPLPVGVRQPQRADRERLMQATLLLNHSDLNVDPDRVDRTWLRDSIDGRIADGSTRVLGAPGQVECKLDYGSRGAGGTMLEGVFTFPESRGRGLATGLVAACIQEASQLPVCLHVAAENLPARVAYARSGMQQQQTVRLLLLA